MTDTAVRLLRLLPLLAAGRSWRGGELAERLGVTTRTLRRDVGRLRELGYQVHAVPGRQGGYALGAGAGLPPLLLDDDSAVAVALGLHVVAAGPGLRGGREAAARAAAAIDQVLPSRLRRRVQALTATTVPLHGPAEPAVEPEVLALLALACRQNERLRFGYVSGSGDDSRRHAEPYRLVCTGRRWYLVARDLGSGEWRSFRVDRMRDPLPTGVRSRPPDPPDAARLVSEGISCGPYRWRARVLLEAAADVVAAMVPPTVAVIEAVDERRCVLISGSDSLDAIALHCAVLGVPFTPLHPPELRDRCAALAARLHQAAGGAAPRGGDPASRYPPAMAPTISNGSAPEATWSGSGASGAVSDRSRSQA
ncbi:MAG TPA: WYL domain-containing protein [Streptosporangiaceae bacterium]|nr:WYL domain-containing protein [Streptosporangiaceae bacterium]